MRILVAPRTPSAIVDAAVEALRATTAAEFGISGAPGRRRVYIEGARRYPFPLQKAKYLVGASEVCACMSFVTAATSRAGRAT